MKKSTSARIEDTLDVVADKIIDLENTAKQLEQIKSHISKEVDRVESTLVRVDIDDLTTTIVTFDRSLDTTNEEYLKKLKKINRGFKYVLIASNTTHLISRIYDYGETQRTLYLSGAV